MIKGLGTDIIEVFRIKASIEKHQCHFLDRLFTKAEQTYCLQYQESARHFAGRFAAKEAIVKALGSGFGDQVSWLDIEILNDTAGKPVVSLSDSVKKKFHHPQISLSISHCHDYATAVAIVC